MSAVWQSWLLHRVSCCGCQRVVHSFVGPVAVPITAPVTVPIPVSPCLLQRPSLPPSLAVHSFALPPSLLPHSHRVVERTASRRPLLRAVDGVAPVAVVSPSHTLVCTERLERFTRVFCLRHSDSILWGRQGGESGMGITVRTQRGRVVKRNTYRDDEDVRVPCFSATMRSLARWMCVGRQRFACCCCCACDAAGKRHRVGR